MTQKIGIFLFILFGWLKQSNAQLKPYAGIEFSFCDDKMVVIQDTEDLKVSSARSASFGFFIGHQFSTNLKTELGFLQKTFRYNVTYIDNGYKQDFFQLLNDEIYQIHVRLIPRVNIYNQQLFFTNTLGFHGYYESSFGYGNSVGHMTLGTTDTLFFNYHHEKKGGFKPLIEIGMGMEFDFKKRISLAVSGHYFQGFTPVKVWDYSHQLNESGPTLNKTFLNKGSYFSLTFSILYRFGNQSRE